MKKPVFALLMALVLCLNVCAVGETLTYSFTAKEYVKEFAGEYVDAVSTQLEGCVALEMEDGAPIYVFYDMNGMCTGLLSEVRIPLAQTDMVSIESEKLGVSAVAMMGIAREMELNHDPVQMLDELDAIHQGAEELFSSLTAEDAERYVTAPVTYEREIGGHIAFVTYSFVL